MHRIAKVVAVVIGIAVLVGGAAWGVRHHRTWRRFAEVEPGVLYRSSMLSGGNFEYVLTQHRIKTVFSLTFTRNDEMQALCDRLGIERHFFYLPGNGFGPDEPYLRFLQVVQNRGNWPVLVHCSAGVQRTGGAVAVFRMVEQGWTADAALAEMRRRGNDGNDLQRDQLLALHRRLTTAVAVRDERQGAR